MTIYSHLDSFTTISSLLPGGSSILSLKGLAGDDMDAAALYGLVREVFFPPDAEEPFVMRDQLKRVMQVFVPTLAFVPVTQLLGIYVASFLLIAGFMIWVGRIKPWKSVLTAYIFSAIMFAVFEIAFDVIMPKGPLERLMGY